jgi:hypothetical protein
LKKGKGKKERGEGEAHGLGLKLGQDNELFALVVTGDSVDRHGNVNGAQSQKWFTGDCGFFSGGNTDCLHVGNINAMEYSTGYLN